MSLDKSEAMIQKLLDEAAGMADAVDAIASVAHMALLAQELTEAMNESMTQSRKIADAMLGAIPDNSQSTAVLGALIAGMIEVSRQLAQDTDETTEAIAAVAANILKETAKGAKT